MDLDRFQGPPAFNRRVPANGLNTNLTRPFEAGPD